MSPFKDASFNLTSSENCLNIFAASAEDNPIDDAISLLILNPAEA